MAIQTGDRVPTKSFMKLGESGPETVDGGLLAQGRVALFAAPGAFTPTCDQNHLPSVVQAADTLREKGVDRIVFTCVNDPFVMAEWAKTSGAAEAGIEMLADPAGDFARVMGLEFDGAAAGLGLRSKRYSALIEQGEITALHVEDNPGQATCSRGDALIDTLTSEDA